MLNDRSGRRIAYFSCLATLIVGSIITAASVNFWMWCFSRVIVGLTIPAVYQIPFIIGAYTRFWFYSIYLFSVGKSIINDNKFITFSTGISWTGLSFVCNSDDMHFLHRWNHDAGWCYIFDPKLGGNVPVHIGAICVLLFIFIHNVSNSN